jgi:hypothetical protein
MENLNQDAINEAITNFKDTGHRMSYFNAAESSYSEETKERDICRAELKKAALVLIGLGLAPSDYAGDMLVSSYDYDNK